MDFWVFSCFGYDGKHIEKQSNKIKNILEFLRNEDKYEYKFTKILIFRFPQKKLIWLSKTRLIVVSSIIWLFYTSCASTYLWAPEPITIFRPSHFTWMHQVYDVWSHVIDSYDLYHNAVTSLLIIWINLWTFK